MENGKIMPETLLQITKSSALEGITYAAKKEKILPKIVLSRLKKSVSDTASDKKGKEDNIKALFGYLKHLKNSFSYIKSHLPKGEVQNLMHEYEDLVPYVDASIRAIDSTLKSNDAISSITDSSTVILNKLIKTRLKDLSLTHIQDLNDQIPECAKLIGTSIAAGMIGYAALSKTPPNHKKKDKEKKKKNAKKIYNQLINTGGKIISCGTIRKTVPLLEAGQNANNLQEITSKTLSKIIGSAIEYSILRSGLILFSECGKYDFSSNSLHMNECNAENIMNKIDMREEAKNIFIAMSFTATAICFAYLLTKTFSPKNHSKKEK